MVLLMDPTSAQNYEAPPNGTVIHQPIGKLRKTVHRVFVGLGLGTGFCWFGAGYRVLTCNNPKSNQGKKWKKRFRFFFNLGHSIREGVKKIDFLGNMSPIKGGGSTPPPSR